ncbi:MAG: hypothetical protein AAF127_01485 [Pseudomonadota bacterium]
MKKTTAIATAAIGSLALAACDVQQTEEGELPEVKVEEGNLPEYEVDAPEVKVGTTEAEVEVPEVDVTTETETVDVPVIGIEPGDVDEDQ